MADKVFLVEGKLHAHYRGTPEELVGAGTTPDAPFSHRSAYRIDLYKDVTVREARLLETAAWTGTAEEQEWIPVNLSAEAAVYFIDAFYNNHRFLRDRATDAFIADPQLLHPIKSQDGKTSFGLISARIRLRFIFRDLATAVETPAPVLPAVSIDASSDISRTAVPESSTGRSSPTGCLNRGLPGISLLFSLFAFFAGGPWWLAVLLLLPFLGLVFSGSGRSLPMTRSLLRRPGFRRNGCGWPLILLAVLALSGIRACQQLLRTTDWKNAVRNERLKDEVTPPDWANIDSVATSNPPSESGKKIRNDREQVFFTNDTVIFINGYDTIRLPKPGPEEILLAVYDGDEVDDDRISLDFNGRRLSDRLTLTKQPHFFLTSDYRWGENYIELHTEDQQKGICTTRLIAVTSEKVLLNKKCYRNNGAACRLTVRLP